MHVTLDRIEDTAPGIQTFWFTPERPFRYVAGEFIEMYLPHENPDNRGDKRWFTLYSSPTENQLAITTTFTSEAGSSFKQALRRLQPGDTVQVSEPLGDFVLPKDTTKPLVFVAGGLGITPIRSITTWLQAMGQQRDTTLLYGVRHAEHIVERALFKDMYGDRFVPIVSAPDTVWNGLSGHIDVATILEHTADPMDSMFYLSGPENLISQLATDLRAHNIPPHAIVTDYFPGYIS